eukprot:g83025.t1
MQQDQDLTRPSKRQKQRHESDQTTALVPAGTVLAEMSPDLALVSSHKTRLRVINKHRSEKSRSADIVNGDAHILQLL